ncbi:MAG: DUF3426 domain-containing protein [Sphingomonadaceae bacterium]
MKAEHPRGRAAAMVLGGFIGLVAGSASALLLVPGAPQRLAAMPWLPADAAMMLARVQAQGLPLFAAAPTDLLVEAQVRAEALATGASALEVAGEIRNDGERARPVPPIELRIHDASGRLLERRWIQAGSSTIPAGGRIAFETVALNPPAGATGATVHLKPTLLDRL